MAARARASFTDDDSISDHLTLEMVRINAPATTTSLMMNSDQDEQITLNESAGTIGMTIPGATDFLTVTTPMLIDANNREYEIPNLFTFKKVCRRFHSIEDERSGLFSSSRLNPYLNECKMRILVYRSNQ